MSAKQKSMKPKRSARETKKSAGILRGLFTTMAGVGQKLVLRARRTAPGGKPEESPNTIKLPGSTWVDGCSAGTSGDIAAMYDSKNYPDS
jgi:hypothetical protein